MVAPLAVVTAVKGVGVLVAVLAAGGALALRTPRARTVAALVALGLTPVLLLGELWQSPQLVHLRAHGALAGAAVVAGVVLVVGLAALLHRRPWLLPVLAVGALPFRIPLESGGQSANLLLPLYVVVASGVLALAWERLGPPSRRAPAEGGAESEWREREPGWTELALIALTVLYALQAFYSADFEQALKNVAFFYVPFMLLLKLLTTVRWTPRVFTICFSVAVVLALVFAGIGFAEYATKHLFWNQKVITSNQFESYFRVNSLFFDPNIYGRFLAMVMIGLAAVLLWSRRGRDVAVAAVVLVVLWAALVVTFSQSSFAALLTGLAVLAALRIGWRPVVAAVGAVAAVGLVLVLATPSALHLNLRSGASVNRASAGRLDLMKGGLRMFTDRPLFGFGSGAFAKKFRERERSGSRAAASASHTIPITVAAEEGVPGLGAYAAALIASFGLLFAGLGPLRGRAPPGRLVTRAYLAAAFAGLIVHTLLYAAFLEDPITWTLLAAGIVLGRAEPAERVGASGASSPAAAASASASPGAASA